MVVLVLHKVLPLNEARLWGQAAADKIGIGIDLADAEDHEVRERIEPRRRRYGGKAQTQNAVP